MKIFMLFEMCLNEVYSKFFMGKYLSYILPIKKVLKQGYAYYEYFPTSIKKVQVYQMEKKIE
jgi:hypothetical protein